MQRPKPSSRNTLLACVLVSACGSNDNDSPGGGGSSLGKGGASNPSGGATAGQSTYPLGGRINAPSSGGLTSTSASGAPGSGGTFQGAGGASATAGTSASVGGFPAMVPPPAASDGSSPYLRECHGETKDCVDVSNLRCLGIRDGTQVNGYSCSNPCLSDSDCSAASTGVAATPACVDFVSQKHCLLSCASGGTTRACPSGMSCYVYPGSAIGYCLWQ